MLYIILFVVAALASGQTLSPQDSGVRRVTDAVLPSATAAGSGHVLELMCASAANCTITSSSGLIDGATSFTVASRNVVKFVSDGSGWFTAGLSSKASSDGSATVSGNQAISGTLAVTGAATFSSTVNKVTITAPATSATLTLANGSTLATSGAYSTTLTATGATTVTLPTSGTLATTSNKLSAFAATTSAEFAGVISNETGTGSVVLATAPTLTAGGNVPTWMKYSLVKLANGSGGCSNATVSAAVFTGAGLNDATSGGTSTAAAATYTVIIDSTGATDTFKWQKNAGAFTELVPITAAAQTLTDGITITFGAVTGHTATDQWVITVTDKGCWSVNGGTAVNADADTSQDISLFTLVDRGFVDAASIATSTACTGATTIQITSLGTASDTDLYSGALTYDLKAAVAASNFLDVITPAGRKLKTAEAAVAVITTTIENVNAIVAGCAVDVWVKWAQLP